MKLNAPDSASGLSIRRGLRLLLETSVLLTFPQIEDDFEEGDEEIKRTPVGHLPAFIPFNSGPEDTEEDDVASIQSRLAGSRGGGASAGHETSDHQEKDIVLEAEEDCEERLI